MRLIRKIFFQNGKGQRWGLNGDQGVYASDLSGFGESLSTSFADLGRGFFAAVSNEAEPQNPLAFTLTFTRNPYETYKKLVDWLAGAGTLAIRYIPAGSQEFCRDVTVNFLQKGELNEVGWLEVPCSFLPTTPWYLPTPTALEFSGSGLDESKRYTYSYTENLRYGTDSTAEISATIAGAGHIPGALELSFYGAIINPRIRLTGNISGKTFGVCSVAASFDEFDLLKFSTNPRNAYVKKVSPGGKETDLLDSLDLTTEPFFRLPVDEPCTLSLESDASFTGTVNLLIYYYYRSV